MASPLSGQVVTVEDVVVGDFQASDQLSGVFLQDADGDVDPATSDGVFAYASGAPDVAAGDLVRVTGRDVTRTNPRPAVPSRGGSDATPERSSHRHDWGWCATCG